MTKRKSKPKYDIVVELDYYGDELDVVVKKEGKIYIYPVENNPGLFDHLKSKLEGQKGVTITDKTKMTAYSQEETLTDEDFRELYGKPDGFEFKFRWY